MIDVYRYTKDTYKHVPNRYDACCGEIVQIYEKNNGLAYDCIMDAWMLGFEQAYRAAKAGKLDFQQQQ